MDLWRIQHVQGLSLNNSIEEDRVSDPVMILRADDGDRKGPEEVAAVNEATANERVRTSRADTKARWTKLIREQQRSGLANKEFCRQRNIKYWAFILARSRIVGPIRASYPAHK